MGHASLLLLLMFCNLFLEKGCKRLDSYSSHLTRFSAPLSGENPREPLLKKKNQNNLTNKLGRVITLKEEDYANKTTNIARSLNLTKNIFDSLNLVLCVFAYMCQNFSKKVKTLLTPLHFGLKFDRCR